MDAPGKTLAVTAETLFLVNLMLAPGLVKAMAGEHFRYPLIGRPFKP